MSKKQRVLIVSPNFPPINAADMQRVRMSLPYFSEYGWDPYVLAVAPTAGQAQDPLLMETVPPSLPIERVGAVPLAVSRWCGIGNIAIRALPHLYRTGAELIARRRIDLVYFSTTMFFAMPLGRLWRRRFGIPYVLDMQDPWLSDYYEQHPAASRPPKYSTVRRLHAVLEPWTMKRVGGLISVSDRYLITLRSRYPWLTEDMCTTLPFGASSRDFEILEAHPQRNSCFQEEPGIAHGVYVGRAGDDMRPALRILFDALRVGTASSPEIFGGVKLHFVGTDYATDGRARKTVYPVARDAGVERAVSEQTGRVPYFEGLQLLKDASFLILIGSDDPGYTASKAYPYLMSGKPILAIMHERSGLVPVLREARVGTIVTFSDSGRGQAVEDLLAGWRRIMGRLGAPPDVDQAVVERFSAREMARRQCEVFDHVTEAVAPLIN